jgi:hypothetical protein
MQAMRIREGAALDLLQSSLGPEGRGGVRQGHSVTGNACLRKYGHKLGGQQ